MIKDKVWIDKVVRIKNPVVLRQNTIRLDKSERISRFGDKVFNDFLKLLTQEDFIAYPETAPLIDKLCEHHKVKEKNIYLSPGTDAAIKSFFEMSVIPADQVLITTPSFPMYKVYAGLFGAKTVEVSYKEDLRFDYELMLDSISGKISLLILANPNSPIGDYLELECIEELVARADKYDIPVLIDEAYYEFSPGTAIGLIDKYENLGVSRTFSKAMGGAGIRVGYVIGSEKLIGKLAKWRLMYEVNQVGVKFAVYLLDHTDEILEYSKKTKEERELLVRLLTDSGYDVISSQCNWIHLHGKIQNHKLIETLNKYNVLFKSDSIIPYDNRKDWIRLTIGPGLSSTPYMLDILNRNY
ncbi:MAG: histidinol-phosphate aminotransferase family protein [Planctomycetes bacterium]|nr:histidinol-phosphate aminotransferase family protein [Planctomycetota bacterium]